MKKLFVLLLITSVFACKNVEQYKAGITELGTKWEAASAAVGEFSTMLDASKAAHFANLDSLKIDSTFLAKIKKTDIEKAIEECGFFERTEDKTGWVEQTPNIYPKYDD